jgi:hypothetical protein|tara:strand:- start:733 stop:897 length:165 start_codon:yes stop_codon:yes gene_type:complete
MYEPGDVEIIQNNLRQQLERKRLIQNNHMKLAVARPDNFSLATESRAEDRMKDK